MDGEEIWRRSMKQVTVYEVVPKKIAVHDYQSVVELRSVNMSPVRYSDEFVDNFEVEYNKIQMPIQIYKNHLGDTWYVAWSDEVKKLVGIEEDQVRSKIAQKDSEIKYLNKELNRIRDMSAWETVKVAWYKLWR